MVKKIKIQQMYVMCDVCCVIKGNNEEKKSLIEKDPFNNEEKTYTRIPFTKSQLIL